MKKLIAFLSVLTILSCSSERKAQYHYKKAIKHGLKLIQDSDTIRVVSIDSIPIIVNDTIIWEKVVTTKDSVIFFRNVYLPKTKFQTRLEYRYKTKVLKQDVLKYKYIYKTEKKQKSKTNWMLLVWGFIIGVLLSFITRLLLKLYLPF
jgi:CHASE1-domain containing sensor protein